MDVAALDRVISRITGRENSLFDQDLAHYQDMLKERLEGRKVLVIGGAGTIGFSYIQAMLKFEIGELHVVDLNENGLAEVTRHVRSSLDLTVPPVFRTYPVNLASKNFMHLLSQVGPFDIVANFAALKHVRSEKDVFSIHSMFETNFIAAQNLLEVLKHTKPERFFCVSTDKATNPVNIMGASKKVMEDVAFSYSHDFSVSTARFANVAFSNGSLLASYIQRFEKDQPMACPADIERFFVSPTESGQLCLIAHILGETGNIFIPKLTPEKDLKPLKKTVDEFLKELNLTPIYCSSEEEAKQKVVGAKERGEYPVFLVQSDTSGEKPFEEFFAGRDELDTERFAGLNVITNPVIIDAEKRDEIIARAKQLFESDDCSPVTIAQFLKEYIPSFNHIYTGKNLDDKM